MSPLFGNCYGSISVFEKGPRWWLLALGPLIVTAVYGVGCGLNIVGVAPASDAGFEASSGSSDHGDAAPSSSSGAGLGCAALLQDLTVKRCIDFDEVATETSPFGFDDTTTEPTQTLALVASPPLGTGNALHVALSDGDQSRDANLHVALATDDAFAAANKITIDEDIVVDSMTVSFAALVVFQIVGDQCNAFSGIAVLPDGSLTWSTTTDNASLHKITLGVPFHLRVSAQPKAGQTMNSEAFVDGVSLGTIPIDYPDSCNFAGAWVGTFFTGKDHGGISTRIDQVVFRVE